MLDFTEPNLNAPDREPTFEAYGDFSLSALWQEANGGCLVVVDVIYDESYDYPLERFEDSMSAVFDQSILVFSQLGRERNLKLFRQITDLENTLRELIIRKMLEHEGAVWWERVLQGLQMKAQTRKQNETDSPLHECYPHHEIFYIDFDDLHRLVDDADTVFGPIFRHRDRVNLAEEITKLNELRNRVMHGRYLTSDNELAIRLACQMFNRLLKPHIRILEVID